MDPPDNRFQPPLERRWTGPSSCFFPDLFDRAEMALRRASREGWGLLSLWPNLGLAIWGAKILQRVLSNLLGSFFLN